MTRQEKLEKLFDIFADYLLGKFESGEPSKDDIQATIKFLSDNNINCETKKGDPSKLLGDLKEIAPFRMAK